MASGFERHAIEGGDGVRLSYLDSGGPGPVVAAFHGLAGTGDEFVATAEAVGGPYRFVLPDLRGHGGSTRRPADVSREAFASDAAALIQHVSPGEPVTLVGQSMGGHTAVLAAAWYPELIARLVLLEVNVAGGDDAERIGNYFRSWPQPFASAAAAREFLGDDALSQSWVAHLEPADGGGLVPAFDADVMQAVMEAVAVPRRAEWKSITAPVTVVFAAESMFGQVQLDEFVTARPGTRCVLLNGGTHDAHLDATDEWAAVLASALADAH